VDGFCIDSFSVLRIEEEQKRCLRRCSGSNIVAGLIIGKLELVHSIHVASEKKNIRPSVRPSRYTYLEKTVERTMEAVQVQLNER
jgi:hydrogenase maturation factor HypE